MNLSKRTYLTSEIPGEIIEYLDYATTMRETLTNLDYIQKAIYIDNFLLLLTDTGTHLPRGRLYKLDLQTRTIKELRPDPSSSGFIETMCKENSQAAFVLTSDGILWRYRRTGFERTAMVPESPLKELLSSYHITKSTTLYEIGKSGMVAGKGCIIPSDRYLTVFYKGEQEKVTVLSTSAILSYDIRAGTWQKQPLIHYVPHAFRMPSAIMPSEDIYLGTCLGEDGGDLKHIDARTGKITLSSIKGQVTGIVSDPTGKDGVFVSTGSWHMGLSRGAIYSVEKDNVSQVSGGYAVFDLKYRNGVLIALTPEKISFIDSHLTKTEPYPEFSSVDGIRFALDGPAGMMVETHIYRQNMICGATPLFVEGC